MDAVQARTIADQLIAAFAWRVDRDGARDMGEFFAANAVLILPVGGPDWSRMETLTGREAIGARWLGRPAERTTRHLHLNLEVSCSADDRISCRSVGVSYRHDGAGWGDPTPVIVCDYDDICVRGADDVWRFEQRRITPVFVSSRL